jgi:hypothetical protein
MPAVSRSQQRLMGQVYGVRKFMDTDGKEGLDPNDVNPEYRDKIVSMAKEWDKKKSLKSYASTKHKKLPEVKEGSETPPGNPGEVPTLYPYLKPESNKPRKKSIASKMQNLSDYRDFIKKSK